MWPFKRRSSKETLRRSLFGFSRTLSLPNTHLKDFVNAYYPERKQELEEVLKLSDNLTKKIQHIVRD